MVFVACSSGPTLETPAPGGDWTIDAEAIQALPELAVAEGRIVCVADGAAPCPARQPIANWITEDQFALWEPGRSVQVWSPSETPIDVSGTGPGLGLYQTVLAVGPGARGQFDLINLSLNGVELMRFDAGGRFVDQTPLPPLRVGEARGFAGKVPLLQGMTATADTGATVFRVFVLERVTDSAGRLALELPIPWLKLVGDDIQTAPPLFATSPVYTLLPDGEVVWGPGDRFEVSRRMADGSARWTLRADLPRAPITAAEMAARRAEMQGYMGEIATDTMLAEMAALSDTQHPAIAALLPTPTGTIFVVGPVTTLSDVQYVRLAPDGQPNGRFVLPKEYRVLLATENSLLVHRPDQGEWRRVQWVSLSKAP